MFQYKCLNSISQTGLGLFGDEYKQTEELKDADAVLVRSAKMHDMELSDNLLAIARAGAGVNNIPLDKCAEEGIVVFNTPGANANAVNGAAVGTEGAGPGDELRVSVAQHPRGGRRVRHRHGDPERRHRISLHLP